MAVESPLGLRIIGFFKLVSALLLTCAGAGIFHFLGHPAQQSATVFLHHLHLEPQRNLIHTLISKATGIAPKKLKALGAATFVYAFLYLIEGVGLLREKRWAEYVTVVITASLVPFELLAIIHHFDLIRIIVLLVNLLIILYLLAQLKRSH